MYKKPFLSVCLIATTRENTIIEALESLCLQTFDDFEVIVTIRKYNDRTIDRINEFKKTELFIKNKSKFNIHEIDKIYHEIEEWNDPLEFAKGTYVGVLEGDDKFENNHLENVFNNIIENTNIGIYATGNKQYTFKNLGYIKSINYYRHLLEFIEIPPPSQTFFMRVDNNGDQYLYNTTCFVYAPEIDLYLRIISDGYDAFHSDKNSVIRSIIPSKNSGLGWKYFQDQIKIIKKNKNEYSSKKLISLDVLFKINMMISFLKTMIKKKRVDLILIKEIFNFSLLIFLIIRRLKTKLIKFRILINYNKEPNISLKEMLKYFLFNSPGMFPNKKYHNFKSEIKISYESEFYIAFYKDLKIYYKKNWNLKDIKNNMDAILNEQSYDYNNTSPHQYINPKYLIESDVIYDAGAAEGLQSKIWSKSVNKIVIFEPDPDVYFSLFETFKNEISGGKVVIVPEGISETSFTSTIKGQEYKFDSLCSLIKKYNLPNPTYIKADIEGHEESLINSIKSLPSLCSLKMLQIVTYHKPEDEILIPKLLNRFEGRGYFSDGVIWFNENFDNVDKKLVGGTFDNIYFPTFRKCLYTWNFNAK
jgi:hypothetical protein